MLLKIMLYKNKAKRLKLNKKNITRIIIWIINLLRMKKS